METYEARKSWHIDFVTKVAPRIAVALRAVEPSKNWTVEAPTAIDTENGAHYWHPKFVSNDGEKIWLHVDDDKRRLDMSGGYGELPDGRQWIPRDARLEDPRISVSADRSPASIAADIARRFLTGYRVTLDAYRARCIADRSYRDGTTGLYDRLMAAGGGAFSCRDNRRDEKQAERQIDLIQDRGGVSYGSLRVSGHSVRVEMSLDGAAAEKLAAFLAGLADRTAAA